MRFSVEMKYRPPADPGGGGELQGIRPPPPLKNSVKGSTQSTKLFLESGVKFTGNALYFYHKLI